MPEKTAGQGAYAFDGLIGGLAWPALRPGGFLLADDIGANLAFTDVAKEFGDAPTIVCSSDDGRGRFGLIRKPD